MNLSYCGWEEENRLVKPDQERKMKKGKAKRFAGYTIEGFDGDVKTEAVPHRNRRVRNDPQGRTIADLLVEALLLRAIEDCHVGVFKLILDLVEGPDSAAYWNEVPFENTAPRREASAIPFHKVG
jgi:hypothetical protein